MDDAHDPTSQHHDHHDHHDQVRVESDCVATLRELDTFLDDELSPETRESIRHHLDCCPDCLGAFDFHAELKIVVQAKCNDDEMPAGLLSRIERCFDAGFELDGQDG